MKQLLLNSTQLPAINQFRQQHKKRDIEILYKKILTIHPKLQILFKAENMKSRTNFMKRFIRLTKSLLQAYIEIKNRHCNSKN